jgi:hypothetical protein
MYVLVVNIIIKSPPNSCFLIPKSFPHYTLNPIPYTLQMIFINKHIFIF